MDFTIVKRQIILEYVKLYGSDRYGEEWSLEDCIDVFRYFYREYEAIFNRKHPKLKNKTIQDIIKRLPYTIDASDIDIDLDPDMYPTLIDAYFEQDFGPDCDYSIQHFMSGMIRALRFYEELY